MNAQSLVGKPYAWPSKPPESFDCWTLVEHCRHLLGRASPIAVEWATGGHERAVAAIMATRDAGTWRRVAEGALGDLVLLSHDHVGLFLPSGVLHAYRPAHSVICTRWRVVARTWPEHSVWRPIHE